MLQVAQARGAASASRTDSGDVARRQRRARHRLRRRAARARRGRRRARRAHPASLEPLPLTRAAAARRRAHRRRGPERPAAGRRAPAHGTAGGARRRPPRTHAAPLPRAATSGTGSPSWAASSDTLDDVPHERERVAVAEPGAERRRRRRAARPDEPRSRRGRRDGSPARLQRPARAVRRRPWHNRRGVRPAHAPPPREDRPSHRRLPELASRRGRRADPAGDAAAGAADGRPGGRGRSRP